MSGATADLAARTSVALVHYPVLDQAGAVVGTAVTNLDIHDIARASRTFGLAAYYVVTPIEAQRRLVERIIGHWLDGPGRAHNAKRSEALARVRVVASLADARAAIAADAGAAPCLVATGARPRADVVGYDRLRAQRAADPRPLLLAFGTGWGLAPEVFTEAEATLAPIQGRDAYNHLSVRSAVAIVLDRLFGIRDQES